MIDDHTGPAITDQERAQIAIQCRLELLERQHGTRRAPPTDSQGETMDPPDLYAPGYP